MKIVLDAMGGDFGPGPNVEAAVSAAREFGWEIALVGRQEMIRPLLVQHNTANLHLPIVHASEVIEMSEHPAQAVKTKKNSSMVVGMQMVRNGDADAFVTMGNTGGALAAALFHLGRIRGILRPALSAAFPTAKGWVLLLDVGANADCKPEYLVQFGLMGSIYAERVMGIRNPRVAIMSNGEEETKGNELVQQAHQLLKQAPINFIGNAEGRDLPAGNADVFVTDGFTGNVIVKLSEGMGDFIKGMLREEIMRTTKSKLGGLLIKDAIERISKRTDYQEIGGAPLLGVDGVVIIGHGRSKARAIRSALMRAAEAVERGVVDAIERGLEALPKVTNADVRAPIH
ncbi:MAG: phosphate acyltransferase PlsX [Anaerolineae bacterium]|jgi:glycerol-3-phosphate acyltransferase PlsX|nr:phosphate acyltransferase PlsX [Anaerolineae bacterium]